MNHNLLTEKIDRFTKLLDEGKLSKDMAKEMINDFQVWRDAYHKEFESLDSEVFTLNRQVERLDTLIETLIKLIVISGNSKLLATQRIMDEKDFKEIVDILYNSKDRRNSGNIYAMAKGLEMMRTEGLKAETTEDIISYMIGSN